MAWFKVPSKNFVWKLKRLSSTLSVLLMTKIIHHEKQEVAEN